MECEIEDLHGVIGTSVLNNEHHDENKLLETGLFSEKVYRLCDEPDHAVLLPTIDVTIKFHSSLNRFVSWERGVELSVRDFLVIEKSEGSLGRELISLEENIERYLSFVCFRKITAKSISLLKTRGRTIPEKWDLVRRPVKTIPNDNQMFDLPLVNCREYSSQFLEGLSHWLSSSEDERIARWMFVDIHHQKAVSPVHFVSACQVVEILGGQRVLAPFESRKLKLAAKNAAKLLAQDMGLPTAERRFNELLLSFNRASLRDILNNFLDETPQEALKLFISDRKEFLTKVISLRNLFVHMKPTKLTFSDAEVHVGPVTYQLMALTVAHQAAALGFESGAYLQRLRYSLIGRLARRAFVDSNPPRP
jgi:hypothetical protein